MESKIFYAKIGRHALLEALNAILAVTDSGRVNIAPDGVSLSMTDPANVAFVHAQLKTSAFDDYNFSPPEDPPHVSQIGLDFERLVGVLSIARAQSVTLSLAYRAHKLELDMEGLSYSVELIEPSLLRKQPRVPKLELPVAATTFFKEWYRAVRAAEMVGDVAILAADEAGLSIEVQGDSDSLRVAFPKLTLLQFTPPPPELGQTVVARFALSFLAQLSKAARNASGDEITIAFGNDLPVRIQFKIAGGEGDVTFLLAPRVE